MDATSFNNSLLTSPGSGSINIDQGNVFGLAENNVTPSIDYVNASFLSGYGPNVMDVSLEGLEWENLLMLPEWSDALDQSSNLPVLPESTETNPTPEKTGWQFTEGLQLQQIDSVEGKCVEIRNYLRSFQTGLHLDSFSKHITRDRLVNCIQLYGKYFQAVQPVLHLPTFELMKTSPVLLVAMMLVGACYSNNDIPAATIVQCAIHVLLVIENSAHERTMRTPPLSSIQANALLCQLLVCTKNSTAYKFATMHRARTFSMAERADIFIATKQINYQALTNSTFDWNEWVEAEMRRRLAYHIFIDDIGSSIFTRSSSHVSPFTFYVDTPCYQSCWVAPTASECLKGLQSMPPQIQVATAIRKIRSATLYDNYLFDASDCGMLEIVIGLHDILFRAMEESLDHENNIPKDVSSEHSGVIPNLSSLLHRDLLNHDVANIANDVVSRYGSDAMTRANNALDAWGRNWDVRRMQDIYDEKNSAFTHPLNFWLLAKLFVVLHFFRNHVSSPNDNGQLQNTEFLAFSCADDGIADRRITVQLQVIDWLSRIRQRRDGQPLSAESFLSQVINVQ